MCSGARTPQDHLIDRRAVNKEYGELELYEDKLLEDLEKILLDLRAENESYPVVVEGKNDVKALRNLDLGGSIMSFNVGLSTVNFAEFMAKENDTVILLPDWDHKGTKLMKEWRNQFRALGVKVIDELWVRLFKLVKKEITCVEDLDRLVVRLKTAVIR